MCVFAEAALAFGLTGIVVCSLSVCSSLVCRQAGGMDRPSKEMEYVKRAAKRSRKQKRMRACTETESAKQISSE